MRRGLISWSREEVPAAVLDERVARLQKAMRAERLEAALAYTSFAQPAAVSWLTHFVPYWSEAMLAVFATGAPVLLAALTKRVHPWIRETSHVGAVLSAPNLGRATGGLLQERLPGRARVGVVELDALPWSVAEPLAGSGAVLVDATALFGSVRQPADEAEIGLARRAFDIAAAAFAAIPASAQRASEVLAAIERAARLQGAEEVILRLAPDLASSPVLRRIEGEATLGARFAVELSLAYKANWIRVARSLSPKGEPEVWKHASRWFAETVSTLDEKGVAAGPGGHAAPPGALSSWTVEACLDSRPLSVVSCGASPPAAEPPRSNLPQGSLAVLSLQLELDDGPWHAGAPLIVGRGGLASWSLTS